MYRSRAHGLLLLLLLPPPASSHNSPTVATHLPCAGGLYMYRSRAVFEGVSPRDLRPFHLDDHAR